MATLTLLLVASVCASQDTTSDALGFEAAGLWMTAPPLLDDYPEEHLWSTRTIPFAELAGGVTLSEEYVKEGRFSGRWADHSRYATIHTSHVPEDWSGALGISFQVYSQEATNEVITFAVESDNEETPWKDYFRRDFAVDWVGWREIAMPLAEFAPWGSPVGWDSVDAVYFFTKIDDRQPNPYTVLHLDAMRLESEPLFWRPEPPSAQPRADRLAVSHQIPPFDARAINHTYPELRAGETGATPIQYESYFLTERALFGYYPRFAPGAVSFTPGGGTLIQYGSHVIQTVDEGGQWTVNDLLPSVIEPYARETLGFKELAIGNSGQTNETTIRFDADGDAYKLCFISDPTGDAKTRTGLLLHSRDGMATWDVYRLPWYMLRFEKFVGHNPDCMNRPPVILLSRYHSPTDVFITIPEKQPDGTLVIPEPVLIADEAICFIPHSGEANNAITVGDKVVIAYARMVTLPGKAKEDGVPSFVVEYDIPTRTLSEPVPIGFGGINAEDNHNWPTIAIDSDGTYHALINGHHNPFVYTKSVRPNDLTEWAEPELVTLGGDPKAPTTTYAGLVVDSEDTFYSVTRNSHPGYYFRLSLHRRKAGQPWEDPKHLVLPFKPYYEVYFHKLVIEPETDRLFLTYHSQSASICLFMDELLAHWYRWPHRMKPFLSGPDGPHYPTGAYLSEGRKYAFYLPPASETCVLVSDDRGESWRLATTPDFQ